MKIISADFIKSAYAEADWPRAQWPEIAFAGRSNVGKSTLINSILNRKGLAKTSSTPGKTRGLNFFLINGKLVFTDLPGYGFAVGDKAEILKWKPMIEGYLEGRENLKALVHIVDVRRTPDEMEEMLAEWAEHRGIMHILVANKVDKLSRNAAQKSMSAIEKALGVKPIPHSSLQGTGKKELWSAIAKAINEQ